MIGLIGIFVITSSATIYVDTYRKSGFESTPVKIAQFVKISTSSECLRNETARPICYWVEHKWVDKVVDCWTGPEVGADITKCEYSQCVYCDKKRVRKEVWEDVK